MPYMLPQVFRRFLADTRGNMVMLCALSIVPLVGAGGLALIIPMPKP